MSSLQAQGYKEHPCNLSDGNLVPRAILKEIEMARLNSPGNEVGQMGELILSLDGRVVEVIDHSYRHYMSRSYAIEFMLDA